MSNTTSLQESLKREAELLHRLAYAKDIAEYNSIQRQRVSAIKETQEQYRIAIELKNDFGGEIDTYNTIFGGGASEFPY